MFSSSPNFLVAPPPFDSRAKPRKRAVNVAAGVVGLRCRIGHDFPRLLLAPDRCRRQPPPYYSATEGLLSQGEFDVINQTPASRMDGTF